ncbi:MAG: hypothetical protein J6M57_08335 [Acidaminococcaceae bacterium]|nr:hypothetical protein [Acidaminococcaceae bacterium]MBQ5345508.1 hypothetical protein [Acidaminococcaceae bacterium]
MDTTEAAVQYRIRKWINIFADCKQSGMTVQQYCDANQLSRDSYYYWFKKVRALTMKQMAPAIVPISTTPDTAGQDPVTVVPVATDNLPPATITLQVGDISLEVNEATPDSLLRRTLRILREVK